MTLEDNFTLYLDNGEEMECEVLLTHKDEKTGKEYVVYTEANNDYDSEEVDIYSAVRTINEDGDRFLEAIETEEEQAMVDKLIDEFFESLDELFNGEE